MTVEDSRNYEGLFDYDTTIRDQSHDTKVQFSHLQELTEMFDKVSVFGLNENDKKKFLAVVDSVIRIRENYRSLDENGAKYLLSLRITATRKNQSEMPYRDVVWAIHSSCRDALIDICEGIFPHSLTWADARLFGMGFWVDNPTLLVSFEGFH